MKFWVFVKVEMVFVIAISIRVLYWSSPAVPKPLRPLNETKHGDQWTRIFFSGIVWFFSVHFYWKYREKIFPKWRWHCSASQGTGQFQIWRIKVLETLVFMTFGFLEPFGTLICESDEYIFLNNTRNSQKWVREILFLQS